MSSNTDAEGVRNLLKCLQYKIGGWLPEVRSLRGSWRTKEDGSPVSAGDVLMERKIREFIFSELGPVNFVGEENPHKYSNDSLTWTAVVDPIDGTENFISGLKIWGSSISIWRGQQHFGSLLTVPELDQSLLTGDKMEREASRIEGFSSSIDRDLISKLRPGSEARIMGCAVFNLINVVSGAFSSYANPVGARSWDMLAGLQLALEHGCEVSVEGEEYKGHYLEPSRKFRFEIRR